MKNTILLICLSLLVACAGNKSTAVKETAPAPVSSGITLLNMDKSVRPQDDFYRHVNGKWLREFELPADKSNFGAFTELAEMSRQRVKSIINNASESNNAAGSDEQKIADLYNSYMDAAAIERKGISAIHSELKRIDAINNRADLSAYMAYADIYSNAPLSMFVWIDQKKSDEHIVYFNQAGLGLPDREYYFKDDEKSEDIRNKYREHIGNMFTLANFANPAQSAELIFNIEKDLAEGHWTRVENRDSDKTYNKRNFNEFAKEVSNVDWNAWLGYSMIQHDCT